MSLMVGLRTLFMVCVPLFIITTGYLMANKKLNKKYYLGIIKIIGLYLICAIIVGMYKVIYLEENLSFFQIVHKVISFDIIDYDWYVEMYIGLFMLIPFLNIIYDSLKTRQQQLLLIITFVILTILPSLLNSFDLSSLSNFLVPNGKAHHTKIITDYWTGLYPITYYFFGVFIRKNYETKKGNVLKLTGLFILLLIIFSLINVYHNYGYLYDRSIVNFDSYQCLILSVLFFLIILNIDLKKVPESIKKILVNISNMSLCIYLLSFVFDNYYYSKLKISLDNIINFKTLILIVLIIFGTSVLISLAVVHVYKLLEFIIKKILIKTNLKLKKHDLKKCLNSSILKIFIIWIVIIVGIFINNNLDQYQNHENKFNSEKLNFITDAGDNQAYHPKIISFEKEWNGYKFWTAFTPYKNANENIENPCINASNNLIDWEVPNGLKNPIDKPEKMDKYHYNSDTHLLYNPIQDKLELFWRYVDDEKNRVIIYKISSSDGINWSEKEIFLESNNRKKRDYVSPAIILEDNKYQIWYVDKKAIYYIEKYNDNITEPKLINLSYKENLYTWHIDVINNPCKGGYELISVAYEDVNCRKEMDLWYSWSEDNKKWSVPIKILSPTKDERLWDSEGIYRSSLIFIDQKYYLLYSAHDKYMNVGVGLMCGKNIEELNSCS